MRYLTDRKRAMGLGSAKSGVHHFWAMKGSSVALLILVPLFVFTFGPALGGSYEEVTAYFARPFPALVAALTFGSFRWQSFDTPRQTGRYLAGAALMGVGGVLTFKKAGLDKVV